MVSGVLADSGRSISTAAEEAYGYILLRIRSGHYGPNHRLIPEEIATEIGMSRMPVREAFRRLAAEGLVTIRPNRGCVVSGLTLDEIFEVFEVRSVLEGLAVRLAMPRMDRSIVADLRLLLERMEVSERLDGDKWLEDHCRFHEYLCGLSGRPKLMAQIRTLHVVIEPYLRVYRHHARKSRSADEAHRVLVERLVAGDVRAAEDAMREHVLGTAPLLASFLHETQFDDRRPATADGQRKAAT